MLPLLTALIERFQAAADFDGSGYVNASEGARFREAVLLAYRCMEFDEADRESARTIADSLGWPEDLVSQRLADYDFVVARLARLPDHQFPPPPVAASDDQ